MTRCPRFERTCMSSRREGLSTSSMARSTSAPSVILCWWGEVTRTRCADTEGCTGAAHRTAPSLAILSPTRFLRVSKTVTIRRRGLPDAFFMGLLASSPRWCGPQQLGMALTKCMQVVGGPFGQRVGWLGVERAKMACMEGGGPRPSSSTWDCRWRPPWHGDNGHPRW